MFDLRILCGLEVIDNIIEDSFKKAIQSLYEYLTNDRNFLFSYIPDNYVLSDLIIALASHGSYSLSIEYSNVE